MLNIFIVVEKSPLYNGRGGGVDKLSEDGEMSP